MSQNSHTTHKQTQIVIQKRPTAFDQKQKTFFLKTKKQITNIPNFLVFFFYAPIFTISFL